MKKLKLLLVGGFLGSGKTTAIEMAATQLMADKKSVGVITNDQGTRQVDTLFFKTKGFAAEEVSGGCFCCHYDDLEKNIAALLAREKPEVIFAESVGSCADLAATVINPLLTLNPGQYDFVLSVFADIRLLVKFLQHDKGIFYDNVNYIFEKQLAEADIIVVNKIDLLDDRQLRAAKKIVAASYKGKRILYQNSLSNASVGQWLRACHDCQDTFLRTAVAIDYDLYGAGEAELAWLDEEIGIVTKDKRAVTAGIHFINTFYQSIAARGYPVGHLKFLMDDGTTQRKISFTAIADSQGVDDPGYPETERIVILINARIQVSPVLLREIVAATINVTEREASCKIIEYSLSAFKPGYPKPTHRMAAEA